MPSNGVS